ncbi:unnamed protein product [Zymoseptoria tritici ST99CH_3D1]|uniref:UBA domain-containing protein n=2 Tax=Zymoseptoria tritici TaxID=1047171 RepID=A0A1X7S0P5_ZYMT9|nr:unnamed protein product [Zymoseptoria tritici ST99CH_3D7]SMR56583.1 unnamed protein product [Zymoseptoria tritici ST99CH_1E4]SMR59439.1 unnamed protein product [Zymoseptoria tritici ST99CH_3D1]
MDDLLGEDWQKPSKQTSASTYNTYTSPTLNPTSAATSFAPLRTSPLPANNASGSSTPLPISRPSSTLNASAKPADQFGSLLSLKSQKSAAVNNVSIQERQRQLMEEKRRQQEQQAQMWDTLGSSSGRGTPQLRTTSPAIPQQSDETEDDILAAFNKAAPVDKASHFPPPSSQPVSGRGTPAARGTATLKGTYTNDFDDDDDPFGLGSMPKQNNGHVPSTNDDDILGDLAKPVTERPPRRAPSPEVREPSPPVVSSDLPQSRAVAELVEMGFPADNAQIALAESGGNVQRAVGWLLQQAHEESRQKAKGEAPRRTRSPQQSARDQEPIPSWARQEPRNGSVPKRSDAKSPSSGEKDPAQVAQDLGSKLFKGANSLWKASQKQMAKTVAEFQQDRDASQPKWMQDAGAETSRSSSQRRQEKRPAPRSQIDVTDEAAMLDMPRDKPSIPSKSNPERTVDARQDLPERPLRQPAQPKFAQQAHPPQDKRPATKLSRQEVEQQSEQAYISPARRKRPTPRPEPPAEPEVDLFSPAPASKPLPAASAKPSPRPSQPTSVPVRPKAPSRVIPSVSASALASSATHRKAGGEAFKRGDFASAHDSYTAALTPLPATHPIAIIVLSNRALTALKTGDAKTAVADADLALGVIGVSMGAGETIDIGGGEGAKDMREFYGKALLRKAEALEHLERWADAASTWRTAVEAGVGGAVSLKGKDRCEKAMAPKPVAAPKPVPKSKPPAKAAAKHAAPSAASDAAVEKLRAANAAATREEDEKFALTDAVDARLVAWKGGKSDNLRALLQSLDSVLWEGAGWKKVGMSDLVMPNKVKIVYMKAIAKVHPDKIPQDATVEQRMVSASVFSTLNEAWDKFKKDNGL